MGNTCQNIHSQFIDSDLLNLKQGRQSLECGASVYWKGKWSKVSHCSLIIKVFSQFFWAVWYWSITTFVEVVWVSLNIVQRFLDYVYCKCNTDTGIQCHVSLSTASQLNTHINNVYKSSMSHSVTVHTFILFWQYTVQCNTLAMTPVNPKTVSLHNITDKTSKAMTECYVKWLVYHDGSFYVLCKCIWI